MNKLFTKKIKLLLFGVSLLGLSMITIVKLTDACRLERVSLNKSELTDWNHKYGFDSTRSILSQPLDSLAVSLIQKNNIYKVDINYSLFNKIEIKTNNFEPVCFILDQFTQKLYGVTDRARIINLDNCEFSWDNPVLTSIAFNKLYDYSLDSRVAVIVTQLQKLKKDKPDLYRLIEEIDFGNQRFLKVAIDGLSYRLKLKAETFYSELDKFVEFVSRFNPDLEGVNLLDLRYEGMIITSKAKG